MKVTEPKRPGFSGKELEKLAAEMQDRRTLWKLADPIVPPLTGLFHGLKAKAHLAKSLGNLNFSELERQLLVVTADLDSKQRLVLRHGSIVDAVLAPCRASPPRLKSTVAAASMAA